MATPRSTYGSTHRSPTSRLDKDCGLLHPTIYTYIGLHDWTLRLKFLVAGARTWNDLPVDVTSAPSLHSFRKRLKLHLFRLSYPGLVL